MIITAVARDFLFVVAPGNFSTEVFINYRYPGLLNENTKCFSQVRHEAKVPKKTMVQTLIRRLIFLWAIQSPTQILFWSMTEPLDETLFPSTHPFHSFPVGSGSC